MKLYVYRGRGASCILYTGSLWRPSTPAGCAIIPNYSFRIPVFTSIPFAIIFPYLNLMIIALSNFFSQFSPPNKRENRESLEKICAWNRIVIHRTIGETQPDFCSWVPRRTSSSLLSNLLLCNLDRLPFLLIIFDYERRKKYKYVM